MDRAGWLIIALGLDALIGDPDWLWKQAKHPTVWCGRAIAWLEQRWNRGTATERRLAGAGTALAITLGAAILGWLLDRIASALPFGAFLEIVVVAILLAQGSLAQHVRNVANGLAGGLDSGRAAVAKIVGRDPETLDESGVARAAIESLAENFGDGVVGPALAYLVFGLPGLLAYKALNTADSMIGHRSARYADFGWAAARLDDLANLVPARLAALYLVLATALDGREWRVAFHAAIQDASKHRSPNAGWPEAAMGGALDLSLAGPRSYEGEMVDDVWMHAGGRRHCGAADIHAAIHVFWIACAVQAAFVALILLMV
jgi:adenosylcobinamide-phosphate synthase